MYTHNNNNTPWCVISVGFCNFSSGSASERLLAITQVLYFPLYLGKCKLAFTAKFVNRTGISAVVDILLTICSRRHDWLVLKTGKSKQARYDLPSGG